MREIDEKKTVRSRSHSILIENRGKVSITGVEDVDSFDEESIIMMTEAGLLVLHGQDLHISKLNLEEGQLIVEGDIVGLQYSDHEDLGSRGSGFFSRLFR